MEVLQHRPTSTESLQQRRLFVPDEFGLERFSVDKKARTVVRTVSTRQGDAESSISLLDSTPLDVLVDAFDSCWLRSSIKPKESLTAPSVRIVDIFSGCGGLSLGISEAARACGYRSEHRMAIDLNPDSLRIFKANFPEAETVCEDISNLFPGDFGDELSRSEMDLAARVGRVDFLVGGPPCQGHSDLNNHTRRADPRNSLFSRWRVALKFCDLSSSSLKTSPELFTISQR